MKRALWGVVLGGAVALAASCDDSDRFEQTRSADIFTVPPYQQLGDRLVASLTFDRTEQGRTTRQTLQVGHDGEAPLVISEMFIEGAVECDRVTHGVSPADPLPGELDATCQWAIDERPVLPLTLEQDSSFRDIRIAYKAIDPVNPTPGTLVIVSNAFEKERIEVELGVVRATPRIQVSPTTLSFDAAGNGDILVRNSGSGVLTLSDIQITRDNPPPRDDVTGDPLTEWVVEADRELPVVLQDNETLAVTVRYTPLDDDEDTATLTFMSDDPENSMVRVFVTSEPVSSNLVIEPNPVVFGSPAGPGMPTRRPLTLTNTGLATLFVNRLRIEQEVDAYSLEGLDSFQIVAGQSRMITISFQPQSAEGSDALLVVETDADNVPSGRVEVPLVRSAAEIASLDLEPSSVRFDEVGLGEMSTATITLSNPGGQPLEISRIAMSTDDDAPIMASDAEFTITRGGMPVTLMPEASHEVVVQFARGADDRNLHLGWLVIESPALADPATVAMTSAPPPAQ